VDPGRPATRTHAAPPGPDLAVLLPAASRGDEAAWRAVVELYARRVYALARSRLGARGHGPARTRGTTASGPWAVGDDAAEEVTQSVFCTVASQLRSGGYTEQGRFESWLFRVAMNRIRDEARRRKRQADPTDPEVIDGVRAAKTDAPTRDDRGLGALRLAMDQLGDADREVIELRHHGQMSFKQMAEMLDEPMGTLLARHHRALRKLKDLMEASGFTPDGEGEPREARA
jgi:RNA polymerase sigma-70 factor, ECF subfamily